MSVSCLWHSSMYLSVGCRTVAPPLSAGLIIVFGRFWICLSARLSLCVRLSVVFLVLTVLVSVLYVLWRYSCKGRYGTVEGVQLDFV